MKRYTLPEKLAMLEEAFAPGGRGPSEVARVNGLGGATLYRWRDQFSMPDSEPALVEEAKPGETILLPDDVNELRALRATIERMIPVARAKERAERRLAKLAGETANA